MKVLGSEKGALGSTEAAPGKKRYMLCTQVLTKIALTLLLIRNTLDEKATSIRVIEVATGPRYVTNRIYTRR